MDQTQQKQSLFWCQERFIWVFIWEAGVPFRYVTRKKTAVLRSHWECEVDSKIGTVVTDKQNKVQFPQDYRRSAYILPGYHKNSTELVFSALFSPLFVPEGMEFRIWYGEDHKNGKEYDNSGKTCTDVYGFY